ncbi:MAG: hypothetical protein ABI462_00975 [Ignavibacteria bacterium]
MKYTEQAYSNIDATLHYVKNTKELSEHFKEHVYNFIRYTKELLKIKSNGKSNFSEIKFLEKRIQSEKILSQRDWLIQKLSELNIK